MLAGWLLSGCASTLSTLDTARPTPPGHVRVNAGAGLFLPTGAALDLGRAALASGRSVKDDGSPLTDEVKEQLYTGALSLALQPPAPIYELMLRTGIVENVDVGLRVASTSARLDGRYRFWKHGDETDIHQHASVGLAASRYFFSNPLFDALDLVQINDFSRWDFEVPLLYSVEFRRLVMCWFGLKYIHTRFSLDQTLFDVQAHAAHRGLPLLTDRLDSQMHFYGGVAGIGAGYKHVWLLLELNAGYTYLRPRAHSFVHDEVRAFNLGGITLYPTIGLAVATD